VNDYGFIETPYRVVKDGYVTDDIQYMEASTESGHIIAQANAIFGDDRRFENPLVEAVWKVSSPSCPARK
jgi:DNA-directed RNA polymerase subunit beta (EC 2.7.7.6)